MLRAPKPTTTPPMVVFLLVASTALAVAQPHERAVRVNGATIAYDVAGEGPPVVLISGGGTLDRRMWDSQVAALSPRYQVLRYDIRGIGRSSQPVAPFSHSEDLDALLQTLELAPAYVVGLSFGAGIAVDLALDHPERVRGLVLASPGLSSDKAANLKGALAAAEMARENGLPTVVDAIVNSRAILATENDATRERARRIYLDNARVFESDFALVELWRPSEPPAEERLSSIRVPTLVLVGEHDSEPVRATADELASRIGAAEVVVVTGAGHLVSLDAPRLFNEKLLGFLARARGR